MQDKTKALVFVFHAEPQPDLGETKVCKVSGKPNLFVLSSLAHHFQSAVRLEPSRARKCFLGGTSSSGMGRFSARRLEFSAVLAENSKRLADFCLVRFVCRGGFQYIFKVYPAVCYIDLSI